MMNALSVISIYTVSSFLFVLFSVIIPIKICRAIYKDKYNQSKFNMNLLKFNELEFLKILSISLFCIAAAGFFYLQDSEFLTDIGNNYFNFGFRELIFPIILNSLLFSLNLKIMYKESQDESELYTKNKTSQKNKRILRLIYQKILSFFNYTSFKLYIIVPFFEEIYYKSWALFLMKKFNFIDLNNMGKNYSFKKINNNFSIKILLFFEYSLKIFILSEKLIRKKTAIG